MSPAPPLPPALGRELAWVLDAIARVQREHEQTTGRAAFHLGACHRPELHEELAGLYAQAKILTAGAATPRARARRRP